MKTKTLTEKADDYTAPDGYNWSIKALGGMDIVHGASGDDTIHGGEGSDILYGLAGHNNLYGDDGGDALYAGHSFSSLSGGEGDDALYGTGKNTLSGGSGGDFIYSDGHGSVIDGGTGADVMFGGTGLDTFTFGKHDSGTDIVTKDKVLSFTHNTDKIDLSAIDADHDAGHQALRYVSHFTKAAAHKPDGQLLFTHETTASTTIYIDWNGDNVDDMVILVQAVIGKGDLIL